MWIVRLALRRPYTIAVMSLFILLMGALSLTRMIVDIFPTIDIPVVSVVWTYPGLSAEDMERRVVIISERSLSTTVNGIARIESQSIAGIGILNVYFQPGADIGAAIAQVSSVSSTILRILPPGMTPPNVIQFNASNVPVTRLTLSSPTIPEEQIYDYAINFIRVRLFTIPGLSTPAPFGGKQRQVNVDIDLRALEAKGLSPSDIVTALQASNLIVPAGTARIGSVEYNVQLNSSPSLIEQFSEIPVKVVGYRPVLLGDVARVSDSFADQTGMVHVNGRRAAYLAILKHADASTLAVVDATREVLPLIQSVAPNGLEIKVDFDQSVFVRNSIRGVVREALLASILVSLMILIFLGSWRSMLIVCTSIPLAIFVSIIGLNLMGQSVNIMTLGGLALAVGMLVDDATVEVENIHRNRAMGKPLTVAILDGARQVAVPAIVATLAICIVFFPVVLLFGPARYLFTPLALAVVLAMLASYLLSRTLVPVMARRLMAGERHDAHAETPPTEAAPAKRIGIIRRLNDTRDRAFGRLQDAFGRVLDTALHHRAFTLIAFSIVGIVTMGLVWVVGTDFFPTVDAGQMRLHFRAPVGTRIEETEQVVLRVEDSIRQIVPPAELETINDMIGIPTFYNLAYVRTENIGGMDAEIQIALKEGHAPTRVYEDRIRRALHEDFPGSQIWFQSADIVSQVLNFGLNAPIDVQVEGTNMARSYEYARKLQNALQRIPGTTDVHIPQVLDYPTFQVNVDRVRAAELGLSQRDVANTMLISLSSSALVNPSYYLSPANGVNYIVAVKVPLRKLDTVGNLMSTPITSPTAGTLLQPASAPLPTDVPTLATETLSNLSSIHRLATPGEISHYTVQRVIDVEAGVAGRDLGSVIADIRKVIAGRDFNPLPAGTRINIRGQNEVMEQSFTRLLVGLVLANILVYFLMVILFQSWLDPFIIMMAVPGAFIGILWMLGLTHTTINVESMMGSIMAVGIAVSNSILLVSFANDLRVEHSLSPVAAALEAGKTRLRPVLMTALAMIIGMLPMALAFGEGGEQNAPLGRAVIGGLLVATVVTLFVVPVIYSLLRRKLPTKHLLEERFLAEERGEVVP
jgi:multidrug efflux pump subunit AcrB